jgi:hypothetical protein
MSLLTSAATVQEDKCNLSHFHGQRLVIFYGMANRLLPPVLTRRRVWLAWLVALAADGLQLLLSPFGWVFIDSAIDVVAMILLTLTLGFHPLFLPTFFVELIPLVDEFPTWTACTFLVIGLRRKHSATNTPPVHPPQSSDKVIDI